MEEFPVQELHFVSKELILVAIRLHYIRINNLSIHFHPLKIHLSQFIYLCLVIFIMLTRIFETPLIDILLILLAIRFIWPGLFGIKSKKDRAKNKQQTTFFRESFSSKDPKSQKDEGEYIDYEEIK